jgi:glycosyltransferase involved in cell wall biosynthesis
VTGTLVEPRRPSLVAAAVQDLLDNPARRRVMGRAGTTRARTLYSWDRVAAEHERVYARLAAVPATLAVAG